MSTCPTPARRHACTAGAADRDVSAACAQRAQRLGAGCAPPRPGVPARRSPCRSAALSQPLVSSHPAADRASSAHPATCLPVQCPDKHQKYISHVLGVPMHKVVVRTKRLGEGLLRPSRPGCGMPDACTAHTSAALRPSLACVSASHPCPTCCAVQPTHHSARPHACVRGHRPSLAGGGFGGKESRSGFINAAAAIPAYHLRRAVRCGARMPCPLWAASRATWIHLLAQQLAYYLLEPVTETRLNCRQYEPREENRCARAVRAASRCAGLCWTGMRTCR